MLLVGARKHGPGARVLAKAATSYRRDACRSVQCWAPSTIIGRPRAARPPLINANYSCRPAEIIVADQPSPNATRSAFGLGGVECRAHVRKLLPGDSAGAAGHHHDMEQVALARLHAHKRRAAYGACRSGCAALRARRAVTTPPLPGRAAHGWPPAQRESRLPPDRMRRVASTGDVNGTAARACAPTRYCTGRTWRCRRGRRHCSRRSPCGR